jgi:SAM-dependent methyltransferase
MSDRAPLTPASNQQHQPVFKHEGGRRWLRDPTLPYPLPVDLEELHRQSLRLLLLIRLFRAPLCNEIYSDNAGTTIAPPRAPASVLEVACGAALWSSACHDYFRKSGRPDVQFTGMDIAPLAPDLRSTGGVNWRFVQHDMRRVPWPFADGEFDFIFVKDADFCERDMQAKSASKNEINRVLAHGGVVEVWSCDHVFRTLLPKPPIPPGTSEEDAEQAEACGAYVISASTPFAASQNRYLADYNAWVEQALGKRHLSPSPCGLTEWALRIQAESIETVSSRRLALPFGETRWEKEKQKRVLSSSQASLRRVALLTSLQFIEAMEPVLRTESGKTQDEWDRWWAGMMKDLLEDNGAASGECLEVGAWWAVKN